MFIFEMSLWNNSTIIGQFFIAVLFGAPKTGVMHTQRNLFEILLNQPEIRLYISFYDWFGSKWTSVWFQINPKMVITIWFQVDLIRFRKDFSVCTLKQKFSLWELLRAQLCGILFPQNRVFYFSIHTTDYAFISPLFFLSVCV